MKSHKRTIIDVTRKKLHPYHLALAAIAVVALYTGFNASNDANGVIPLKTTMPTSPAQQVFPMEAQESVPAIEAGQEMVIPQESDEEILDMLRSAPVEESQKEPWKTVRMRVTAYCACTKCCGRFSDGRTANMHKICQGDVFVAADKRISFGTEMIIPGYNQDRPVEVMDRGRLIKGNRLDVFFNSHKVAKKWGTRYLDVMVMVDD